MRAISLAFKDFGIKKLNLSRMERLYPADMIGPGGLQTRVGTPRIKVEPYRIEGLRQPPALPIPTFRNQMARTYELFTGYPLNSSPQVGRNQITNCQEHSRSVWLGSGNLQPGLPQVSTARMHTSPPAVVPPPPFFSFSFSPSRKPPISPCPGRRRRLETIVAGTF